MSKLIGRIMATERSPTTMDDFNFWTNSDLKLHAFDIVKVEHIEGSYTFGVIESISHITDAQSFLTSFISNDFGDVDTDEPTLRVGMNYAKAKVSFNSRSLYTPVHNNAKVYLATADEITMALGLDRIQNPLVCGALKMYEAGVSKRTVERIEAGDHGANVHHDPAAAGLGSLGSFGNIGARNRSASDGSGQAERQSPEAGQRQEEVSGHRAVAVG